MIDLIKKSTKILVTILFVITNIQSTATAKNEDEAKIIDAKSAYFHILINQRKENNHPWHGPGDIFVGPIITNLPNAPGAVLCIVTLDGSATCPGQHTEMQDKDTATNTVNHQRDRKKKPLSPCPSSYNCEFDDIALPNDEVFGVVFIDPGYLLINLVDAVILTRKPMSIKDPVIRDFDPKLRTAIAALAPPGPFEKKRRMRLFQVRMLNDCIEGCTFSQSQITISINQ